MNKKSLSTLLYLDIVFLFFAIQVAGQQPEILWTYDMADMAFGMAAMEDIDRDGKPEIVFGTYRNDERIIALNAEDGSLLWDYNTGGCNDVAPLIYDVDGDGYLEVVAPGSCAPTTVCLDGATGSLEWETTTHGSDSPPTVADVDNDGKPEILHGEFNGWVICINGEDGSVLWEFQAAQNAWIQTAPTIFDVDMDGDLDFVVATWSFGDDHRIMAYQANNHALLWESDLPEDVIYHGASHAYLDDDTFEELVIGDYSGQLMVINAEDGSTAWTYRLPFSVSISAPTSLADLDGDGDLEILFFDWFQLVALNSNGTRRWQFNIPDNSLAFRGCAVSDIDNDQEPDVVFATTSGWVYGVDGQTGEELWSMDLGSSSGISGFEFNHGPLIGDFDGDARMDVFVAGGYAEYPVVENNIGRAFALATGEYGGPDWPMFRRDVIRSGCVCDPFDAIDLPNPGEMGFDVYFDPDSRQIKVIGEENVEGNWDKILLFDALGRRIAALNPGNTHLTANIHPGMYLCQIFHKGHLKDAAKITVPY